MCCRRLVHFDKEVAGFDSRDGTTPKALAVLCAAGQLLRGKPTLDSLARALNDVTAAMAAKTRALSATGTTKSRRHVIFFFVMSS